MPQRFARERCREHLESGRSFAFDATNIVRQTRRRWIDLFADYDARIEIVYVKPPPLPHLQPMSSHVGLRLSRMAASCL